MSDTSVKKAFGVYSTIVAAILSLAAGIYFQMINGTFGATKRVCYDAPVVYLLIGGAVVTEQIFGWPGLGGAVVTVLLIALKRYGLASAVVTAASGCSILFFIHKCYWYISDVFVAIDEKGFDQKFIIFVGLAVAAFLIGEISIYARKTKPVKA